MALVKETDHYKYRISLLEIVIPGQDTVTLKTPNINSMGIEKDFDNDHFPILHLSLNIPPELYFNILENKTTVKFRVRLESYIYDANNEIRRTNVVFNDSFSIFIDDNATFVDKDLYLKAKEENGGNYQLTDFSQPRDFFLFKEKDLLGSKTITNAVITSGNMTDISTFLLSNANINNILMTPLDNNQVYNEVVLLPVSTIHNLIYLEKQYGMYYHGLLLFFDFERAYFINKTSECTAWKSGEFKDVVVESFKSSNPNSITPGCIRDEDNKKYIIHAAKDSIEMITSSIVDDQLSGNDMVVIDAGTGNVTNVTPSVQQRGSGTKKILIDNFNNPFTKKSMEYRKLENDGILKLTLQNIDMEALTPNKKFTFIFEDTAIQKQRGGSYRLSNVIYTFDKQGLEYTVRAKTVFKKIK